MQTEQQLLAAYSAGRSNLLLMAALTGVNTALALFGSSISFLFTAFFPYVAANWAEYGYLGLSKTACVLLCCVFPILAWFACWFLSGGGKYLWLKIATALFALDTIYMLYFFVAYGFDPSFILTALFHAFVLWQLIRASIAAKKLANLDFEPEGSPAVGAAAVYDPDLGGVPAARETEGQKSVFRYNRAYAKRTGADKSLAIALTFLIFFAAVMLGTLGSIWLLETVLRLDTGVAVGAAAVVGVAAIAAFIVAMVRLSPFLEAAAATYRVSESGTLSRDKFDIPPFNHTVFSRLEVVEERPDRWVVSYENASGVLKKTVIPKAYPGLEKLMPRAMSAF